ncbi:MAG: alpha,alpha-phosphotrehalase [Romboutsia sp.]|uniref:alpha,alpha-phosphotrehalase n=1 Tax=Romboutsia sp. TaxID=1965302 RepID=UPI003F400290
MMEKKWWHDSVVYQIYPRSFCDSSNDGIGDLKGIISKLDYLKELGIDVIWLSPVYKSPNDDNGYDISDYMGIMDEFGTMEDMDNLLKEANSRGIKILMDLVLNHTSDEHEWFKSAKSDVNSKYRDYYVFRKPVEGKEPNELGSTFSGSAWELDEESGEYYLHLFSKKQPDLNWENEDMRNELYNMINFWIDKGVGGFRLDVIDLVGKQPDKCITGNGPKLHEYIKEMNSKTFGDKDLLTVGETWGATPDIAKLYSNPTENELSMVFQFEHVSLDEIPGKSKWDLAKLDFIKLKEVVEKWQTELKNDGWNSLFWNNHDLPRIVSRWGNDSKEYRELSAKMLGTVLHMQKGTPYIYQGEEIGMTNVKFDTIDDYKDIELLNMYKERIANGYDKKDIMESIYAKGRDNARTPMHWDESENAGFTKANPWIKMNPNYVDVNVKKNLKDENSVFNHYKKLIKIRKEEDAVTYGDFKLLYKNHKSIFAYIRELNGERLLVIANFYGNDEEFILDESISYEGSEILLSNYKDSSKDIEKMTLRPYEAVIYKLK